MPDTENYHVDEHGLISSPGKFQGEAAYVPHFWMLGLDGGADDDIYGYVGSGIALTYFVFRLTDDDRKRWPSLANIERLELWQSEDGFVFCDRFPSDASFTDDGDFKEWPTYLGYVISRGGYVDSSDDSIDGWYVDSEDSEIWDRRGPGYPTLRAARAAIRHTAS
jgi:hypothetical protein